MLIKLLLETSSSYLDFTKCNKMELDLSRCFIYFYCVNVKIGVNYQYKREDTMCVSELVEQLYYFTLA